MKKVLGVAAIAVLGVVALASCKKDYTCTCTTTVSGQTTSASGTVTGKKADAKEACEKGSSTYTVCKID